MSRGGTRVYFGRLPRDVRERDVEKFIRGYGNYREISIKLGYGFVEFDDSKDADDCVYDLNGKELLGERIVVEHARNPVRSVDYGYRSRDSRDSYRGDNRRDSRRDQPRRGRTPPVRTEHRLAVMNLSSRCNWQDLKEFMGKAGEVTFADAHKRRQGEGVVEFSSKEDMKTAMKKLDDAELFGRHIKLKIEKVKSRHSGSRSRSRSPRSRHKSKSHSRSHSRSPKRRRHSSSDQRSRSKQSRSRSASPSKDKKSQSRSKSPEERSRSGSPKKDVENGEEEVKEVDEVEEELDEEQPEQVEENGDEENAGEDNMDEEEAEKKEADADEDGDDDA